MPSTLSGEKNSVQLMRPSTCSSGSPLKFTNSWLAWEMVVSSSTSTVAVPVFMNRVR